MATGRRVKRRPTVHTTILVHYSFNRHSPHVLEKEKVRKKKESAQLGRNQLLEGANSDSGRRRWPKKKRVKGRRISLESAPSHPLLCERKNLTCVVVAAAKPERCTAAAQLRLISPFFGIRVTAPRPNGGDLLFRAICSLRRPTAAARGFCSKVADVPYLRH